MKKMKRLLAVLMTLAMVLGMAIMTFTGISAAPIRASAAPSARKSAGNKPQPSDTALGAVTNVATGAIVRAYRIIEPMYSANGFTGYRAAAGTGIANPLEPTSNEVTSIAANKALLDRLEEVTLLESGPVGADGLSTYSGWLGAGYWLVLVTPLTGSGTKIYNPMLIGVYYSVEGTGSSATLVSGGAVNANSRWSLNSEPVFAKSAQPQIIKRIVGSSGKDVSDGNENGNDVAVGDTVSFQIEAQIPAYSKAYQNVKVDITDQTGGGLIIDLAAGISVNAGSGPAITAKPGIDYTLTAEDRGFRISFTSEYALAHSGETMYVNYVGLMKENAGYNFDANENTAILEYTSDPRDINRTKVTEDRTYTYTFGIDSSLNGASAAPWNKVTQELIKTGEAGTVSGSAVTAGALSGAVFTLTGAEGQKRAYTATSDALGYLSFTGLDAGMYYLQETAAPEGYSLNDAVIPVEIRADYNEDGTLRSYTVTVDGKAVSTYTAAYQINDTTKKPEITNILCADATYEIRNTRLGGLPSTGGIGTTIFTVVGCAIMVLAAALFFSNRRKTAKK